MSELPDALYTPEQVRELDRRAIEDYGLPGEQLMERAGASAYRLLRRRFPDARRLLVLCGGGNNGGDGYVIARRAHQDGLEVTLCPLVPIERLKGSAAAAARGAGEQLEPTAFDAEHLAGADLVVDALLGTGLDRPVAGELGEVIAAVNAAGRPVLAVDVPSGLSARTGAVLGVAVRAALTPTFIGLKQGLFTGDAPAYTGEVVFDDLQVPPGVYDAPAPVARLLGDGWLRDRLPPRERTAHKGRFGHVLVVGGDHGMGGAARLAAEAAGRTGAGLVSVATRPAHVPAVLAARPELMVRGVEEGESLAPLLERATVLACGPGLGTGPWGRALLAEALAAGLPLVLDADALSLLSAGMALPDGPRVLTPHPGEAARLLDTDTTSIQQDRFAATQEIARRYRAAVVLKGAGTVVADVERCAVCAAGNPGMASGGMGDVLTGVVAALLAQGLTAFEAAAAGALVHATAADRAAAAGGERGLLAGDLFAALRTVVNPA
ncbi:NAD(P)H-hydrate dehydratase [Sediminicurvatus halobius]|uniref:Bifunctional NAD(P)H-hydrate repair enzyme n=1 Tax=Sediminicurvatus halobius TaxID=2182432 RepID=A0A2U2N0U8_9GAMM|nr:NAD(P)H-hydrate dehydratase [Spiribacter halobius]PWG62875.1 bifunctional ADP-dependent NAD(P)H-hydrate dehydratase/NAD(P)H-hydrate epimerase [Spiribacter halobius]UEX76972.1 NAD(P)H-hydrate dehydratase [Spiribacter halobius]